MTLRRPRLAGVLAGALALAGLGLAIPAWVQAAIDVSALRADWPKQVVHELEVGRYPVRWRQFASRQDGIFGAVRFIAPLDQERIWSLTTDYTDVGGVTPGVRAVRYLTQSPTAQVIEVDVRVLWKTLTLRFEVEQDPPREMRFRLVHDRLGEYRGVCWLEPTPDGRSTVVELATWLQPSRPVPARLILLVERMTFLRAARAFLDACDAQASSPR
jgi:hypothetical protein